MKVRTPKISNPDLPTRGAKKTSGAHGLFLAVLFVGALSSSVWPQQRKPQPGAKTKPRVAKKANPGKPATGAIEPSVQAALEHVSADSLRGNLSFLASDLLEGRDTPSRGLELASEYIAAQFRRAGVEPGGDAITGSPQAAQNGQPVAHSYFQTTTWNVTGRNERFIELTAEDGKQKMRVREAALTALGINTQPPPASEAGTAVPSNPAAGKSSVQLRNVVGLLRGSDPVLKETYVIVSAHYDHIGVGTAVNGDAIFNGANDDGSGTVSVIELAAALARLKERPKRSILFITWFGEEKGLQGSRYYGRHPVVPLNQTVAMVNLEQVGRTDSSEGPQLNNATLTGFDFTDLGPIFKAAGAQTGITVYKHEKNSDAFFGRSDNQALADAGIPAHTLCTAFVYPDYHGLGDHWEKVDYENMAKVDRMVALALLNIANSTSAPQWNEANPKTGRYVQAWKQLHAK